MLDLARQAHLPPHFANTPVKRRPTIAAASHERSCDVDRRVLTKLAAIVHWPSGRRTRTRKDTFMKSLDCLKPKGMMVSFGQSSGSVGSIDLGVFGQKGSLFFTRPTLGRVDSFDPEPCCCDA